MVRAQLLRWKPGRSIRWPFAVLIAAAALIGTGIYLKTPHLPPGSRLIHVDINHISAIAFSGDSSQFAMVGWDNRIRLYNVATGKLLHNWNAPLRPQVDIAFSPIHDEVAITNDGLSVLRWNTAQGTETLPPLWPPIVGGYVRYSPDGRLLAASGMAMKTVCIWDAQTGHPRSALGHFHGYAGALAFSPNGKWLALADQTQVYLWDIATGKQIVTWPGQYNAFVTFSPDSAHLAFGGPYAQIQIIDLKTRRQCATLPEYDVQRATFAPDGRSLVIARYGDILAFDIKGRELRNLTPNFTPPSFLMRMIPPLRTFQHLPISCLAFSPDGRYLAYSYADTIVVMPVNRLKLR